MTQIKKFDSCNNDFANPTRHAWQAGNSFFGFCFKSVSGLFVDWVEHPDIFCWVSFLYPTYLPAIFVLSAKPNKMDYFRFSGQRRG
jgi:hypothetical protein